LRVQHLPEPAGEAWKAKEASEVPKRHAESVRSPRALAASAGETKAVEVAQFAS
jgi:hypothetical protein